MTAEILSPPALGRGAAWPGRASQLRRQQVRAGEPGTVARVQPLWESLVDVLRGIGSPASALLCTADGAPVAAYGLPRTDLPRTSRRTGRVFAARSQPSDVGQHAGSDSIEILELTSGQRHTVIASVPGASQGDHLLSVTAEGVSLPLLQAWTRCAAEDLCEVLAAQP